MTPSFMFKILNNVTPAFDLRMFTGRDSRDTALAAALECHRVLCHMAHHHTGQRLAQSVPQGTAVARTSWPHHTGKCQGVLIQAQ